MTTLVEYSALAAYVYNDQRGGGAGSPTGRTNLLGLPTGWADLTETASGFPAQVFYDSNYFSFTADAFVNASTGELVISYKGTDFLLELTGRVWNTLGDMATDIAAGMAGYLSLPQFIQAAAYYEDVKTWAVKNGYDPSKISFTGHSLGAGLASVMSVWFDRPATVFADAPFEAVAHSALAMAGVAAMLAAKGVSDSEFSAFVADAVTPGTPRFFSRQELVRNYFVQGEFLDIPRTAATTVFGTTTPITIGSPTLRADEDVFERALALHSMNLHAALLFDDRLRQLITTVPSLMATLLDKKLYAADPNYAAKDLITYLVNDQIRQGFSNDSALKRFTSDLLKLDGADGMLAQPSVRTGLIAAAMEYYYFKDAASTTAFFATGGNGVHFKYGDIGVPMPELKSPRLLNTAVQAYLSVGEIAAVGSRLATQDSWHVQTGTSGMNWTTSVAAQDAAIGGAQTDILDAGAGDDILIGGAGQDFLTGGANNDTLIGGVDLDWLDGGTGNDKLLGGQGADIYHFAAGWGADTIADSDGGVLQIEGFAAGLPQGKKTGTGRYQSSDGKSPTRWPRSATRAPISSSPLPAAAPTASRSRTGAVASSALRWTRPSRRPSTLCWATPTRALTTAWREAPTATKSSACRATMRCRAAMATTSSRAALATTCSPVAGVRTFWTAATATTGSSARPTPAGRRGAAPTPPGRWRRQAGGAFRE